MTNLTLSSPTPNLVPACDTEGDRRQQRADRLQAEKDKEYDSTVMPEDLAPLVGWNMSGTIDERLMWEADLAKDDAEVGRIVRKFIAVVRSEAADKRAERRMKELDRGMQE